jgi:sulfite exporter TauE/SafE
MTYQLGRLLSYSILAVGAGFIGEYLKFPQSNPWIAVVPAILIGSYLVYMGIKLLVKNSSKLQLPKAFSRFQGILWKKALPSKGEEVSPWTSFSIGSLSIFLPCGFLYGIILALAAYGSPVLSLICIFTFWLGTLPAVSMAPGFIRRILRPLYNRMPIISSSFLIIIGIITITHRVMQVYQEVSHSCH